MDIKSLGRNDGIIVNTQKEWNQLLELSESYLYERDFQRHEHIIIYPTDHTVSDMNYAIENGFKLYNVSDFLNVEPQYEIY